MSSENVDNLTSSFHICISLIFFSCLIALASTSNAVLKMSGHSGQPYLIPSVRGFSSRFSLFMKLLAVSHT